MNWKCASEVRLAWIVGAALLWGGAATGPATSAPARGAAALAEHFAALKNIATLRAGFDCEKRMKMLDTPLVSSGTVSIARAKGGASVRFSTVKPYTSEVILHNGQVLLKSEHETQWTKADPGGRPGLAAIMGQLADWSVGEAGALGEMYDVTSVPGEVPRRPESKEDQPAAPADFFALAPRNKAMAQSVRQILLAFDSKTHGLVYLEIVSTEGDVTRYWFHDLELDAKLAKDTFTPAGVK